MCERPPAGRDLVSGLALPASVVRARSPGPIPALEFVGHVEGALEDFVRDALVSGERGREPLERERLARTDQRYVVAPSA
jgi:hypothetical protein